MMNDHNGEPRLPPARAAEGVGRVASRLLDLSELQAELLGMDAKKSGKTLVKAAVFAALAIGLSIAAAVVLLLTISALVVETTRLSVAAALAIALAIGLILVLTTGWLAWRFGRSAFAIFHRSRDEFRENLSWIKHTLRRQSGTER